MILKKRAFLPIISSLIIGYSSNSFAATTWVPISNGSVSFVIPLIPDETFPSPINMRKVVSGNTVSFFWDDIKHASKYLVQGLNSAGQWVDLKVVYSNQVTIDSTFNDYFQLRVTACNYNSCKGTGIASRSYAFNKKVIFIHTDLLGSPVVESH
ncbi:hypothetical protein [Pseudoalteromonas luteoviolacea]|uniref:Uncharacterized protein n=1 Tax=Pseudoalteromonas luteoviolacea NCIMB 1942 TaxID=1365253 RepID=A0A167C0S1_9GAMM|nr:hypothetical protein [Pseudoalteromonas luteoviolacea]KZN47111.1 hypothetical protein N482_10585 [Pseudoalteromonas luteoviolacea NCIMB 1942]KZX02074.1 hypothetical protein JL49_02295 [Pseudoalteromonas luteoviolacea]